MPRFKIKQRSLTAGAFCAPCIGEEFQAKTAELTRSQFGPSGLAVVTEPDAAPVEPAEDLTVARWSGVIAVEGQMTGDGRLIEAGAFRWDDLPIPLRWDKEDSGAHLEAVVVGMIETIERRGGDIYATGYVDLVSDNGWGAAQLVDKGMLRGVSVDPDEFNFEIRVRAELLDAGVPADDLDEDELEGDEDSEPLPEIPTADADGYITVAAVRYDDEIMVATDAQIRAATLVDIPAFRTAKIAFDAPLGERPTGAVALVASSADSGQSRMYAAQSKFEALMAGGAPRLSAPPAAWFRNPGLAGPTALTVTDDGRVFGHLAQWDSCHLGYSTCTPPPKSQTGYAWFKTGLLVAADGSEHAVGQITLNTGHAGGASGPSATLAHYDHTGSAAADVSVGEDQFGIWVAGALRAGVTDDQKRVLRASPLSGDWRRVGNNLELVAALCVNVPGYVVPRGMVASGSIVSLILPAPTMDALVAAGFNPSEPDVLEVDDSIEFTVEDMRELRVLLASNRREQASRAEEAAEMARSLAAEELAREMRG